MKNKGGKNWRVDIIRAKYKPIIKKYTKLEQN